MSHSDKQTKILAFLVEQKQPVSKKDLVERFKGFYYANTNKHLGDMLQRMVAAKTIMQPKRGYYQAIECVWDANQPSLFDAKNE